MDKTIEDSSRNTRSGHSSQQSPMLDECESQKEDFEVLMGEVRDSFSHYLRKRPVIASSLVFLAGFYVGWKIKPW